jgi:hypothetical protein
VGELDTLFRQLGNCRVDVVAHQVQLVMAAVLCRVSGELGRGQGEDQPASSGVHWSKREDVAQESAERACILREITA